MSYNEKEFEQLVNGETLDSDDIEYKLALKLVKLAMGVIQQAMVITIDPALHQQALKTLHSYGNWREEGPVRALLTQEEYRQFLIKDCGDEEEADAEIFFEAFEQKLFNSPTQELWYRDPQGLFHRFRRYYDAEIKQNIFIYARGTMGHESVILIPGEERPASPYLDELIRQVREKFTFDVYTIPLDQWMLTAHGNIH